MVISFLRCLHEEKLKVHVHIGEIKQTSQIVAENIGSELPSSATRYAEKQSEEVFNRTSRKYFVPG